MALYTATFDSETIPFGFYAITTAQPIFYDPVILVKLAVNLVI